MASRPDPADSEANGARRALVLFGTRPEVVKLAPVIRALDRRKGRFATLAVDSGQHMDMVTPFARDLEIRVDRSLAAGAVRQSPADVCHRVVASLGELLARERPDVVLVEGDTVTAFAGSLAAFYAKIPVGHVEAGLRSGDSQSPFPEEMNRRLITQLASFHFAPTQRNVDLLLREGTPERYVALTGNPVVDAVHWALNRNVPSPSLQALLRQVGEHKLLLLTTHRRESFGPIMEGRLRVLRRFVERHEDVVLVFPVHPNPEVSERAQRAFRGEPRVLLVEPLGYLDFIHLLARSWLIVSDSGGVQEEAPSVGRPVLVIRENTERAEAIEAGVARLVGESEEALESMLSECHASLAWFDERCERNPFGDGASGPRIADALDRFLTLFRRER